MKVTIIDRARAGKAKAPSAPQQADSSIKRHEPYKPHEPHKYVAHQAKRYHPYGHPDHPYYWPTHPLYKPPETAPGVEAPSSHEAADFMERNRSRLPHFEVLKEHHANGVNVEVDGHDAEALFEALENEGLSYYYDEDESFKECGNCGMLFDPTELDESLTCQRCGAKAKRVRAPKA